MGKRNTQARMLVASTGHALEFGILFSPLSSIYEVDVAIQKP